jgi:hypothetical protein
MLARRPAAAGMPVLALLLALLLAAGWIARPSAHDVPVDVAVQALVQPEGNRLRVIVRVPLRAMRDIEFPTRGPGFLEVAQAEPAMRTAAIQWVRESLAVFEDDRALPPPDLRAMRIALPSDRSFESWEAAVAGVTGGPLPLQTELYWDQGLLDVLFEYPIASAHARFSVRLGFARFGQRVTTVLRFLPPDGAVRAFEFSGDPGLVRLDPRWHQAALRFVQLGFLHILDGPDHLLFLLCLVVPCRRLRPLVLVVTSFTVAHSITLIGSAFGFAPDALWFPPLVETLIAISIVYMALENAIGVLGHGTPERSSWRQDRNRSAIAFAFGLVHGFGFAFALRETMQFAGSHLLTSLVSFNVGVELGQILVLLALVPALQLLFRFVVAERPGTIVLSAFVAHTGWHWTADRWAQLRQFDLLAGVTALTIVRWAMVAVGLAAAAWVMGLLRQARRPQQSAIEEATPRRP